MTTIGYATLQIVPSLRGVSAAIDKQLAAETNMGKTAGQKLGTNIAAGVGASSVGAKIGKDLENEVGKSGRRAGLTFSQEFRTPAERAGAAAGLVIGKSLGAGIKLGIAGAASVAAAGIAGIGYTLTKGFERLQSIDTATFKLKALGHSGEETKQIMDNALASVKGTAFSLADAATSAASAVAAGIKPGQDLTKYLGEVGDAAAVAGTNFGDMAHIFDKIQTSNKAYTDDLNQLADRGLPIFTWLQKEYGVTADQLTKMVEKGEVDSAHFKDAIDKNIGGAAQKMGQSFDGAVQNLEASTARLGANFITALLGGDPGGDALAGPTQAIGNLTTKFDDIGVWVTAHRDEIHGFFIDIKNVAIEVGGAIKDIGTWLIDNKGAAETLAAVFVGWKVIGALTTAATAAKSIATALGLIEPAAATASAAIGTGSGLAATGLIGGVFALAGALGVDLGFTIFDKMQKGARDAQAAMDAANQQLHEQFPGQPVTPTGVPAQTGSTPPNNPLNPNNIYRHATGGVLSGPGSGISDSILLRASNGEFIVNADATRKNLPLLEIINSGKMPGYATGGAVNPDVSAAEQLVGHPYSQGTRFDCSGTVARIINAALGQGGGLMTTKTARSWLAARGFVDGLGGPGQISVGWYDHGGGPNDGHMAMTLSDGRHAESGGSHNAFLIGAGASGADSAQFDHHMHLALAAAISKGPAAPANSAAVSGQGAPTSGSSGGSGVGGGGPLPSSISGLSSFGLAGLGSGVGTTGAGSDLSKFGNAAASAVSGQVSSALGVFGVGDNPPFLQAASQLLSGIKVGGHAGPGKSDGSLFDGSNIFGQGRAGSSALPLSASSTGTGTPPPDGTPASGHGSDQAPGPVFNTTISAFDTTDALRLWDSKRNQMVAAKLSTY